MYCFTYVLFPLPGAPNTSLLAIGFKGLTALGILYLTMRSGTDMLRRVVNKKNPAAVALGRKGGQATAKKLSQKERTESARNAAQARWKKKEE